MRRFAIAGIPRSGTSLAAKMITEQVPDAYCVNEVDYLDSKRIPALMNIVALRLSKGMPVRNRYGEDGKIESDVVRNLRRHKIEAREAPGSYSDDPVVGIKGNTALDVELLLRRGFKILFLVRDPRFTLASWAEAGRTPWRDVTEDNLSQWWRYHPFPWEAGPDNAIGRRVEVWQAFAEEILHYTTMFPGEGTRTAPHPDDRCLLWTYEQLTADPNGFLRAFAIWFGLDMPAVVAGLENRNREDRFESNFAELDMVVDSMAPARIGFGYE